MLLLQNYCAKIYSRSGLAAKHGIHVSRGTAIIDSDFLGPMAVWLINLDNNNSYEVKFHDQLAQMTFEPVTRVEWREGTDADFDAPTERSPTGFGSTGKKNQKENNFPLTQFMTTQMSLEIQNALSFKIYYSCGTMYLLA